jgi:hypothetical protein
MFGWHYDSNSTPSLYWQTYAWVKDIAIYGQAYLKVGWKRKNGTLTKKKFSITKMKFQDKDEDVILADAVDVQNPNIFNMFFAPDAVAPDIFGTASWVIEKSRKPLSKILEGAKSGQYLKFDENALSGAGREGVVSEVLEQDLDRNAVSQDDQDDPMIDLYEYWEDNRLVLTANHCVKLRDEVNPFGLPGKLKRKPYICGFDYLIANELWQIGEVEMLRDLQNEMTTLRRMRTDVNNLTINPMWIINEQANVNEAELGLSRPGGYVHALPQNGSLADAVTQLRVGNTTSLSSEDFAMLKEDAKEITGQFDYSSGETPERRETASAVQMLQAAANMRYDIKVRSISHSFMDFNYMILERWKQLLTKPHPLQIPIVGGTGVKFVKVTRDMLPDPDEVDLVAQGDPSMLLKDARKQEIAQMYEIINNSQFVMPQTKLKAMIMVLKSRDLEGSEQLIQEIEQAQTMLPQQPSMNLLPPGGPGGQQGQGGPTPTPPVPPKGPQPQGAPAGAQIAQGAGVLPFPRPQR